MLIVGRSDFLPMLTYLLKRLLIFVPTLLVVSLVAFGLNKLAPGDPVESMVDPSFGEGIADYKYFEQAYRNAAKDLGLDRPAFYLSFTAKAYPDTLHKLVDKDKIFTLEKLIAQYGNWPQIEKYYQQIRTAELALFNWPDSIGKEQRIVVRKTLGQLYLSYRSARVKSLLNKIKTNFDQLSQEEQLALKEIAEPLEQLRQYYTTVESEASRSQLYQPVLRWNGFDNQYHNWLIRFLCGDFGVSYYDGRPVVDKIKDAAWWTLMMNLLSIFFTFLLAVPLGVLAAQHQGSLFDRSSSFFLFLLYSVPSFWLATLLVIFFTTPEYGMPIFASIGLGDVASDAPFFERLWVRSTHLVLPVFCITYGSLAFISRQVRGGMLSVIRQDYIRTARAKGLEEGRVIWQHAFRNSLFPLITIFA
ncbi:MAG: ABC transporter permease, partial [Bacteroidota bacterium]